MNSGVSFFQGAGAVLYREWALLRKRWHRHAVSMTVMPLMYLLAFSYAMEDQVGYLAFLVPGLSAMVSMTQGFAIGPEINVARFYFRSFEEVQSSPVTSTGYVLGQTIAGVLRALAAIVLILILGTLFGVPFPLAAGFWFAAVLNGFIFSSLAVIFAMTVHSHQDQMLISNFVITPMAFLGGTFFPIERLPSWAWFLIQFFPVTHASGAMRSSASGGTFPLVQLLILFVMGALFFIAAICAVQKIQD